LVNDKPYEVALERLSKDDQSFVNQVEDAVNRK
jgi:hypothetical protein